MDRSWEHINRSQTHECGNGAEAAQFLFWEHINRNFFAVRSHTVCKLFLIYDVNIAYNFRDKTRCIYYYMLFSNHKRRRLWYLRIFTQIPIKPVFVGVVPQAIRTPCLKQGFGVSILHDLCCFNLFRLLETWSKHWQDDQSRSFFCLKLRLQCCFNLFRLSETWSKHEQEDQSRSFFCLKLRLH